ncbi:MAG: hypothetical protein R3A44_42245 [Caldilineaceae bacterium]
MGIRSQGLSGQPRFIEFRQSAINFFEHAEQQGLRATCGCPPFAPANQPPTPP